MPFANRVDRLEMSLFDEIEGGCASSTDRRSLLAVHAALAARGDFSYLEVGSYHGASLQPFIADPRCRRIVSIDRRDVASPDVRAEGARYPENTTIEMLKRLERVPGADMGKLSTIDATTEDVHPLGLAATFASVMRNIRMLLLRRMPDSAAR